MRPLVHVATAVPFALAGQWAAAAACILPDLPWLVNEVRYQRARRRSRGILPWHTWVHSRMTDDIWLHLYRCTHSPAFAALLVLIVVGLMATSSLGFLTVVAGAAWVLAGWYVHIALDLFTHDEPLRVRPLYPWSDWAWPYVLRGWRRGVERRELHLILLSGGWESAACLAIAHERAARTRAKVMCVFFDYAQPYEKDETRAVEVLAHKFDVARVRRVLRDIKREGAVFEDRNEKMLRAAVALGLSLSRYSRDPDDECRTNFVVYFGCRAPLALFDKYGDSNWQFARRMSRELGVRIRTPFVCWPKWAVKRAARKRGVQSSWVSSSEGYKYE